MTAEQLAQEAAPVVAAVSDLQDAASGSGNSDDLRADNVEAATSYQAAVTSWIGFQAQEVLSGARPYSRWSAYGADLLKRIRAFADELRQSGHWWQQIADAVGRSADAAVSSLEQRVGALQSEVRSIGTLRDAVLERYEVLRQHAGDLSDEVIDLYYGEPGDLATAAWNRLVDLTDGMVRLVGALRNGTATLSTGPDGELQAVADDQEEGLHGAPLVIGILGAVAVIVALAAWVRAYYTHADEISRAETARLELQLTAQGKGDEVLALRKARTDADKARQNGEPDPLALAGKVVAGGAAVLAGAWGLKLLAEYLFRRTA